MSCWCEFDDRALDDEEALDVDEVIAQLTGVPDEDARAASGVLPLVSLTTSLRARHRFELGRIAGVAGRRADDDVVLLAVHALDRHRVADGSLGVRRPDVVAAVHRVGFLLEDHGLAPVDGVPEALAALLRWESEVGLGPTADPLDALLEPLVAHFGVAGALREPHVCQCFAPHDPHCPLDHRLLPVRSGHLVHARIPDPLDHLTAPAALDAFAETLAAARFGAPVTLPPLDLLGVLLGSHRTGRLWVFGDSERPGRYDALYLDNGGAPYVAKTDRRYRDGYRWCPIKPVEAQWPARRADGERYPTAVA